MYVTGGSIKPDYKEAKDSGKPFSRGDTHDIFFDFEPHRTFPAKQGAEREMGLLQGMRVHAGNHYCHLEVEQVGEKKYVIVCNEHPELPH